MTNFKSFLTESISPEIGKMYKADWDGPSLVKVVNVTPLYVELKRVKSDGTDVKGPENYLEVSRSEWNAMVQQQIATSGYSPRVKQTSDDQLLEIAKKLIRELKALPQGRFVKSGDVFEPEIFNRPKQSDPKKKIQVTTAIRYWGDWSNPEDAEDEEDYDWQVLSKRSADVLDKFINATEVLRVAYQ